MSDQFFNVLLDDEDFQEEKQACLLIVSDLVPRIDDVQETCSRLELC